MSKHTRFVAACIGALLTIACASAQAEWRCDCTRITGSCKAGVVVQGSSVHITSDQRTCARVEYYLDGQPFVALVVDGEHQQDWLSHDEAPEVLVQSCQVCEDHLVANDVPAQSATAAAGPSSTARSASPGAPLIKVQPAYPDAARGRSGDVLVELSIGPDGAVTQARVLEAKPSGLFDQAALDASRRWRYPPGDARTVKERIDFQPPATARAGTAPAAAPGPRNACVKEGNVDELVDIVQVQLINACAEPVLVRTCAEGFAERADQWVCDEQPVALVARGDALNGLLGEMTTDSGRIRFGYTEEKYLSRPAASRYALIACAVGDRECYSAAARWADYLNAKPSDVDPLAGSDVAVAVVR
jgi:protein TonB